MFAFAALQSHKYDLSTDLKSGARRPFHHSPYKLRSSTYRDTLWAEMLAIRDIFQKTGFGHHWSIDRIFQFVGMGIGDDRYICRSIGKGK